MPEDSPSIEEQVREAVEAAIGDRLAHSTEKLAYSPAEAADLVSVSRAHFYSLMGRGEIPSLVLGRSRRIRREALLSYLARLEAEGPVAS